MDAGAARALRERGGSLLLVGIIAVESDFGRGDTVLIIGPKGKELARGIIRYSSADLAQIKGLPLRCDR